MADRKSALAKALEARKRTLHEFPAEKFIGAGGREFQGIKVYAPLKSDEVQARLDADRWVKDEYKGGDDELRLDARTVFLLHRLCRDFDDPENFPAFPTPAWMIANLKNDELDCLLRCVAAVKHAESPLEKDLGDELVDAFVAKAADHYGSSAANFVFTNCDRSWLEDYAIAVSKKLHDMRNQPEPEPEAEPEEPASEAT